MLAAIALPERWLKSSVCAYGRDQAAVAVLGQLVHLLAVPVSSCGRASGWNAEASIGVVCHGETDADQQGQGLLVLGDLPSRDGFGGYPRDVLGSRPFSVATTRGPHPRRNPPLGGLSPPDAAVRYQYRRRDAPTSLPLIQKSVSGHFVERPFRGLGPHAEPPYRPPLRLNRRFG